VAKVAQADVPDESAGTVSDDQDGFGSVDSAQAREILIKATAGRRVSPPPPWRSRKGGSGAASGGLADGLSRYYANNVSPDLVSDEETPRSDPENDLRKTRRETRFSQRSALWAMTTLERVKKCGRATNGNEGSGLAAIKAKDGVAYWSGFCTCGSIWACPVCSAKIRCHRADEFARMIAAFLTGQFEGARVIDQNGNPVYRTAWMVTLTARHKKYHHLDQLFDAVANGWRRMMSGKAWAGAKATKTHPAFVGERDRLGVFGWIRSLEVTWGSNNGFHPHLHIVLLLEHETGEELAYAMHRWTKTWATFLKKQGYQPPSVERGVTWSKVTTPEEAGAYIAKTQEGKGVGNELARGDMKTGGKETITMFEILEYFRLTGDMAAIPVWHEYEGGTYNRRAMTTSRGLRGKLLPNEEEETDEELAAKEIGGDTLALLPAESLRAMRRVPNLQTKLLDAYEEDGFEGLVQLLTAYHLEYDVPSDEKPS
jgi:hypothetical protein